MKKKIVKIKHTDLWCVQWVNAKGNPDMRMFGSEYSANQLVCWLNNLKFKSVTKTYIAVTD